MQRKGVNHTAHLSTKRKAGAVFLVSKMQAGRAASAIAWKKITYKVKFQLYSFYDLLLFKTTFVSVAIPLILCIKLSTTRSATTMLYARPK